MTIYVYGDLILDEYIYGKSERLSPEAPVPVVLYENSETKEGGAGNVFNNIKSLTPDVQYCTKSITSPPKKTRIFAGNHYITRVDYETNQPEWEHVYPEFSEEQIIVISDYEKGQCKLLDKSKLPSKIIVDPKNDLMRYKGVYCLKPNLKEFKQYSNSGNLKSDMIKARAELELCHLIVTLGAHGVAYCNEEGWELIESESVEVCDVTGAGDTFTAVLAYFTHNGLQIKESIVNANKAAGISVKYPGTYIIKKEDIEKPLVFTNGCFDILHVGHIELLNYCKSIGDVVIGLNSDQSVKRLKGEKRPINQEEQIGRAHV